MNGMGCITDEHLPLVTEQTVTGGRLEYSAREQSREHFFYYTVFLSLCRRHRKASSGIGIPCG